MFDVRAALAALRPKTGPRTVYERGVVALEAGDYGAALSAFEETLAGDRGDVPFSILHNKRGVALIGLGRRAAALDAFSCALDADERCAPALANVGNLLLEDGHPEDAIDYYEAALAADDRYALGYRGLGVALRRLGRTPESVRALRSADRFAGRPRRARA